MHSSYQETIDYLFTRLPMFSRIGPAAFKKDLTNTIAICSALGQPEEKFRSVHVAGTNGKGSVSHMIAAILQCAGYKTGLYTSPHLRDFRERIKVNGRMVSEEFVVDFVNRTKEITEKTEPSFFELTVAMAFDYFASEKVDIAVIETGLGGRLDSTNIIRPEVSVITNIGWDHMNMLGDTLEKIAFEKAGIIKEQTPVVIGEVIPETKAVFENNADEKHAPVHYAQDSRYVNSWNIGGHRLIVEVARAGEVDHRIYELDLPGIYQVKNLLTVLETCTILEKKGWDLNEKAIHDGLKQAKKLTGLHGRWDVIRTNPMVVTDVAHNIDGIKQLLEQVEVTSYQQLHLVFGMVKDKDIRSVLSLLPQTAFYYFTQAQIPRALPARELKESGNSLGLKGEAYANVNLALREAMSRAQEDDLVIVCGSVFVVGEINL